MLRVPPYPQHNPLLRNVTQMDQKAIKRSRNAQTKSRNEQTKSHEELLGMTREALVDYVEHTRKVAEVAHGLAKMARVGYRVIDRDTINHVRKTMNCVKADAVEKLSEMPRTEDAYSALINIMGSTYEEKRKTRDE